MQKVIILGMQDENGELIHKELIFDKAAEIDTDSIEQYNISDSYLLEVEVNFTEKCEIVISHALLDYSDLEEINKFYDVIINEFKENGSTLIQTYFIYEDELINKYGFESEDFY